MQNFISFLFYLSLILCLLYIGILIVYSFLLQKIKAKPSPKLENLPSVSVLVAARNEAHNIIECLTALNNMNYPEGQIEILIGNDQSTDYTQMQVEGFIKDKPKFKLFNLTGKEFPETRGKARVLAYLASQAQGEYFLITDADISVPNCWAENMVGLMINNEADMCGGTTNIKAEKMLEKFQQVDWLYFMGIIHSFAAMGKPLTIVGNNMGLSKKAYDATGGYGQIPFSITEDYALFDAVSKLGFKVVQNFEQGTMVYSKPLDSINAILKQRKRWLTGGWDLPLYYHIVIFIFGAWYFALPILAFYDWKLAVFLLLTKEFMQLFQFLKINKHLSIKTEHPLAVFLYDVYLFLLIPITCIYFLLPSKNVWKGRKY
jgi:cellulose synthase/poly-beta-1,6-N-acetylglucosamine synthase-like glycosyltransferase